MQTETQNQMLKTILDQGTHITPLDALNMIGTMRLAARVFELKQSGYPIDKYVREVNGKRVTYYYKCSTLKSICQKIIETEKMDKKVGSAQ